MKNLLIILIVLLFSCQDKKDELIDLDDIIDYNDGTELKDTVANRDSAYDFELNLFVENGIDVDLIEPLTEKLFPDRFGPDSTISYQLLKDSASIRYHRWIFSDSAKTMNAFYNWIDCFGSECKSFYLGEEKNFQVAPFILLAGSSNLVFIEDSPQRADAWLGFHDSLGVENNWALIIEQSRRGKAHWYTIENDKKVKLKK